MWSGQCLNIYNYEKVNTFLHIFPLNLQVEKVCHVQAFPDNSEIISALDSLSYTD